MAGMSQRQELQNARSTRLLSYGNLGTLTYDKKEKKWKTLRIIEPQIASTGHGAVEKGDECYTFPLRHLSSKVVFDGLATLQRDSAESQADESDGGVNHKSNSSTTETSYGSPQTRYTSWNSAGHFQGDASTLAGGHNVNSSMLLDFGSAVSTAPETVRSEPVYSSIAASVSGSNRECLRLIIMGDETLQSLESTAKEPSLQLPSISGKDQAYWPSRGGPIQQISFAGATGYSSTWMAVRLQRSTTIFHPLIHQEPVAPHFETASPEKLPSSVLDANPVLTIPISRTGGHAHADVAFHPQDPLRLALIDEHGNWSVWLLEGPHGGAFLSCLRAKLVCSGKIWTWSHEKRLRASLPYHDGWHKISWYINPDTQSDELFVCNRRTADCYNTSGEPLGLTNLGLGHARENQMILDVQWSKSVAGHCFVLTSTCIIWLSLVAPNSGGANRGHKTPRILLIWRHFRDRGDRTLHLVLLETETATAVLLMSRVVELGLVFRVGLVNGDHALPASLADPRSIFLPEHPYHIVSGRLSFSLLFRAVESGREGEVEDRSMDSYLFKLFSLHGDLSIVEHLYSCSDPAFRPVEAVVSLAALPKSVPKWWHDSRSAETDIADFIVADDLYEEDLDATGPRHCGPSRYTKERKHARRAQRDHDWQDVCAYLTDASNSPVLNARKKMDALFGKVADDLDQSMLSGIHTLSEILSAGLHITDVDDDSEQFETWISTINAQRRGHTRLERLPVGLSDGQERHRLTSIYDSLVAIHVAPLSLHAPDRARMNKERLARRVTADVLLASTAVSSMGTAATDPFNSDVVSEPEISQSTHHRPSPARTNSQRDSTPPKTPTGAEEDSVINRLRSYTNISRPTSSPISPISISPTLTSVLRHLPTSPHIDPKTYDWRTTERSLAAEQEEELAIAAAKADPKAKRKAEKAKLASARKEEARRRAAEEIAASSRSMPKILSSQTGISGMGSSGDAREVQSSQVRFGAWDLQGGSSQENGSGPGTGSGQWMEQGLPMTQPERGVVGARYATMGSGAIKGKGKKRAAGF